MDFSQTAISFILNALFLLIIFFAICWIVYVSYIYEYADISFNILNKQKKLDIINEHIEQNDKIFDDNGYSNSKNYDHELYKEYVSMSQYLEIQKISTKLDIKMLQDDKEKNLKLSSNTLTTFGFMFGSLTYLVYININTYDAYSYNIINPLKVLFNINFWENNWIALSYYVAFVGILINLFPYFVKPISKIWEIILNSLIKNKKTHSKKQEHI